MCFSSSIKLPKNKTRPTPVSIVEKFQILWKSFKNEIKIHEFVSGLHSTPPGPGRKGWKSDRTTLHFSPSRSWTLNILRPSNFFVTLHSPPSEFLGPRDIYHLGFLPGPWHRAEFMANVRCPPKKSQSPKFWTSDTVHHGGYVYNLNFCLWVSF